MSDARDYLIRCAGGERGDLVLWWGPDRMGYTTNIDGAGRYTREEAERIAASRPAMDVAVPATAAADVARSVAYRESFAGFYEPKVAPRVPRLPVRCWACGRMTKDDRHPSEPCNACARAEANR